MTAALGPDEPGVSAAIRARHMVRAFTDEAVDPALVDELIDLARRAPSAGKSQALDVVVLDRPVDVDRYWTTTMTAQTRGRFRWQGLLDAPVMLIVCVRPTAYTERYAEADKARAGLGDATDAWPVPYWWVDAGAAIEHILLAAVARGLGACEFGVFDHEPAVRAEFGIPDDRRIVATVALGHPDPERDEPARSARRPRRPLSDIVHRGGWRGDGAPADDEPRPDPPV